MTRNRTRFTYFSRFRIEGRVGGGGRRALQIIDEFTEDKLNCICAYSYDLRDWSVRLSKVTSKPGITGLVANYSKKLLPYLVFGPDYLKWTEQGRKPFLGFWRLSQGWKKEARRLDHRDIVIIDDPYYFRQFISHLKGRKIRVVGLVHNIETFFPSYCKDKYRLDLTKKELSVFRKCDLVVTMSREENYFLTNNGINVVFHKYYPPESIEEGLLNIRQARQQSRKQHFVLLGSAGNPETKKGMAELTRIWKDHIPNEKLCVVGYDTEFLKQYSDNKTVVCLGEVSDDKLTQMLIGAKTVIAYQKTGPGALTKIPEMLLANIPVIGNFHALRTYHGLNGVHEFDRIDELTAIVGGISRGRPNIAFTYEKPGSLKTKIEQNIGP